MHVELAIRRYLANALDVFADHSEPAREVMCYNPRALSAAAFGILTRREFCYLSKSRANEYAPDICLELEKNVRASAPLQFHLDIGGGYHASTDPQNLSLSFSPGLGELLLLRQIKRFDDQVRCVYGLGTRFSLVIDNLTALLVNDIPIEATQRYCQELRHLIRSVGLDVAVDVLVESERFSPNEYQTDFTTAIATEPSAADIENVARFIGRPCGVQEAKERIARYQVVTQASEMHLAAIIEGVHMTQRATRSTFGFRSFPGGDSRIQAGEVILLWDKRGAVTPKLLTSRTKLEAQVDSLDAPELLPAPLNRIGYTAIA